jgi:cell division protein FtsA
MAKRTTLTAIDVGTTKVCTIIADFKDDGELRVVGTGIVRSSGIHKAMVVNMDDAKQAIRESVRKAEMACNYKVETAYVGITGRHVTASNNHGEVTITRGDRLVRPDDLKRVLANAQSVKVPSDRKLIHVIPRTYIIDGQDGVRNPVGMHGFRLDVETHVITAAVTSVQNLVKCVRSLGIDIDDLVLEPIASSEAVLTEDEKQAGVIMADIGGGTTDISVFKDGSIYHTSVLPVAGYQITRDVAIGLGLPFDIAEQMKKKYGSVMPIYDAKSREENPMSSDSHGASYQDLCEIIRARVDEILRLIVLELPQSEYQALVPAGLVLTGGASNLCGIEALGAEILQMPVRVGAPINMPGLPDNLNDPAYATAVGLMLWGAKNRMRSKTASSNANFSGGIKSFMTRFVSFFNKK